MRLPIQLLAAETGAILSITDKGRLSHTLILRFYPLTIQSDYQRRHRWARGMYHNLVAMPPETRNRLRA